MTVDIVLPYYGDVRLMQLAVGSVLAQRRADWRLTVLDDGYPDGLIGAWLSSLNDDRIRYFRNETTFGAPGNHRKSLSFVEHDLSVVMGADDVMLPHYLDVVVRVHEEVPDAAIVQPGVEIIDENGAPTRTLVDNVKQWYAPRGQGRRVVRGEDAAVSLLGGNWLYNPSLCWRTDALRRISFRPHLDVFDLALPLDVLTAEGSIVVEDTVCFKYRRHRSSSSSWKAREGLRFDEERRFFDMMAREMQTRGWYRAARAARLHSSSRLHAANRLPAVIRRGDHAGAVKLIRHALGVERWGA